VGAGGRGEQLEEWNPNMTPVLIQLDGSSQSLRSSLRRHIGNLAGNLVLAVNTSSDLNTKEREQVPMDSQSRARGAHHQQPAPRHWYCQSILRQYAAVDSG